MSRGWLVVLALMLALACNKAEVQEPAAAAKTDTAQTAGTQTLPEAKVGGLMPAYTAKLLDGSTFDTTAERGNVVLLNVWATWCGPCRYEIPELEKLHRNLAAQKFKVVGVSVDEGDPAEVKSFVAEQKMTYPVALDAEGRLAAMLQTTVLPTSILVDRKGNVVWKKIGIVDAADEELSEALAAALKT